jgi:DeoR family fructose operon transcriptional repressor
MFTEERQMQILSHLHEHKRASVSELCKRFGVSPATIRRDLKELEDAGLLKRTHGGAISLEHVGFEPSFQEKEDQYREEKRRIAIRAASMIREGETVLLDAGTTTWALARELTQFQQLTVVTNSVFVIRELAGHPSIELLCVGGTVRGTTQSMVGPVAEQTLKTIRVDKAFIGTNGVEPDAGLTTPHLLEAQVKKAMIRSAKQVVLLSDSDKAGKVTFAQFAPVEAVDVWITDTGVPEALAERILEKGVRVIKV